MYRLEDIRSLHLELTSKCQARCPMCPRRINGGILNPLISLCEIDLETYISWFPKEFIKQLDSINLCGNLGDPIIASECLEILEYTKHINPSINLKMHTNGSAREPAWWKRLSKTGIVVTFGIDGLEDTHHLYRINTAFDKILENAKTFISHGGRAEWDMLVFEHNHHQIDECRQLSIHLGFIKFNIKHTSRFQGPKFTVLNDRGRTMHVLRPSSKSIDMIEKMRKSTTISDPKITCKAKKGNEFYVSANGDVSPCCWFDFSLMIPNHPSRIDFMDRIDQLPSLKNQTLAEIFNSSYFDKIAETWNNTPLRECSRQCGTFDKTFEQFDY